MGTEAPRLTHQSLKVLKLFSDNPQRRWVGIDIMRGLRMASGTLYPILLRFETHGLLTSEWEAETPEELGRPRRRLYTITLEGRARAHNALAELQSGFALSPELGEAR